MKHFLYQTDRISTFPTAPTFILVLFERQAGMVVVVEGTERLVHSDLEPESLRDPLDRKVAKLLKLDSIHNYEFLVPFRYSSVLV